MGSSIQTLDAELEHAVHTCAINQHTVYVLSPDPPPNDLTAHSVLSMHRMYLRIIRPAIAALPSECGIESSPTYTISLSGIESLPTAPVTSCISRATLPSAGPSWVHTSREIEKSVFGQVSRQLSCRYD